MGYYMRYIVSDEQPIALNELKNFLKQLDGRYKFEGDDGESIADVIYADEPYGQIEINVPGDGLFEEEIGELVEFVEDVEGPNKQRVLGALRGAKSIFCIQVLFGGREANETLTKLDPIWNWCFQNKEGLLQAGGEGYYDKTGLILEVQ